MFNFYSLYYYSINNAINIFQFKIMKIKIKSPPALIKVNYYKGMIKSKSQNYGNFYNFSPNFLVISSANFLETILIIL